MHEAGRDGVVHARVEVIKSGFFVVLVACVKDAVIGVPGLLQDVAERVVVIRCGDMAVRCQKCGDIRVAVIHVVECIDADGADQEVKSGYAV